LIYEQIGEIKKSFNSIKKAIKLEPDDPETMNMMAFLYILVGKTDKAKPLVDRAIMMDPLNPTIHTGKWWVYLAEGKYADMFEACSDMYNIDNENLLSMWACGEQLFQELMGKVKIQWENFEV
jgi:tetratricopeptide (TPR) repeat protein